MDGSQATSKHPKAVGRTRESSVPTSEDVSLRVQERTSGDVRELRRASREALEATAPPKVLTVEAFRPFTGSGRSQLFRATDDSLALTCPFKTWERLGRPHRVLLQVTFLEPSTHDPELPLIEDG
jgi:hypothetical protein